MGGRGREDILINLAHVPIHPIVLFYILARTFYFVSSLTQWRSAVFIRGISPYLKDFIQRSDASVGKPFEKGVISITKSSDDLFHSTQSRSFQGTKPLSSVNPSLDRKVGVMTNVASGDTKRIHWNTIGRMRNQKQKVWTRRTSMWEERRFWTSVKKA